MSAIINFEPELINTAIPFEYTRGSVGYDKSTSWAIDGFIPKGTFGCIYGQPASFKSFFALEMAYCISTGTPFFSREVDEGITIIIAGEGETGVKKRLKGLELTHGKPAEDVVVIPHGVFASDCNSLSRIIRTIYDLENETGKQVKAIFIDTLARSFEGDENSPTAMGDFILGWGTLQRYTEASVVCVHHLGKDPSKGGRGHSALPGACDFEFIITRERNKLTYKIVNKKQKDEETLPDIFVELEKVEVDVIDDRVLTTLVRKSEPQYASKTTNSVENCKYFKLLKEMDNPCTRADFRERVKRDISPEFTSADRTRMSKALSKLESEGVILISKLHQVSDLHTIHLGE